MRDILSEASRIISDPIAWQKAMDHAPASINLRGSSRFWATVCDLSGLEVVFVDGTPQFSEVVLRLKDNIGLRLYTNRLAYGDLEVGDSDVPIWIRYEFCEITEDDDA